MSSTLKQAIQALKGRIADAYTAVSQKGGTLPATQDSANLPTAIASIPSGGSIDGYYKANDVPYNDFTEFLSNFKSNCVTINDSDITSFTQQTNLFNGMRVIKTISFPNLTRIQQCGGIFAECRTLETCDLPNVNYIYQCSWDYSYELKRLNLIAIKTRFDSAGGFNRSYKLIDIIIGRDAEINLNLSSWNPTTALDDSSSSLVEAGETFANNKEKLLYNIREHIAKILNTNAGNKTITFSANIKAAIQSDPDTLAAFPANWTIA